MENIIVIVVLAVVVSLSAGYVYKAKKNGKKCIGCPNECNCTSKKCK